MIFRYESRSRRVVVAFGQHAELDEDGQYVNLGGELTPAPGDESTDHDSGSCGEPYDGFAPFGLCSTAGAV